MKKAGYVDGFVFSVPKKNFAKYKKMAADASKVWKRYGALDYKECIADDMNPDTGGTPMLGFPKMAKVKKNEKVWFSYVAYKSKKHRDEVNKKVMAYYTKKYPDQEIKMPFDMKRFAYGGFKVQVGY